MWRTEVMLRSMETAWLNINFGKKTESNTKKKSSYDKGIAYFAKYRTGSES